MVQQFKAPEWSAGTNIYEVNLRQYTREGTIAAFATHLPRLRNMGVEVLWFMPVTPIAAEQRLGTLGSYYACGDYTSVNTEFGDINDFKKMVKQAHQLEMKVIIDWVANHTGHGHTWTKNHKDYYHLDANGNFTERNGWKDVIDLNYNNPALQEAMIDAMAFWVNQADIDGFRCDMAHLVPLDFWVKARTALDAIKPLFWLAECDVPEYHAAFDCSYAWDWMHASEKFAKQELASIVLEKSINRYRYEYPEWTRKLFFTTNHDENSWNGTEYEKYGQNALPLAVFCCLWPGIPLVYSGQELPLKKRLKFFDKDEIPWDGNYQLESFYKVLLELRKRHPVFLNEVDAQCQIVPTSGERQMCFICHLEKSVVVVAINFSHIPSNIVIRHTKLEGEFLQPFTNEKVVLENGGMEFMVAPNGYMVLTK